MKTHKNKQPPLTTITPHKLKLARARLNKCWIKLDRNLMPPSDVKVIVRCHMGSVVKAYIAEFRYGKDKISDVKLNSCHFPIPQQCWKTEGFTHWMPIPN